MQATLVFDIETVHDVRSGRVLHKLEDSLPDAAVAQIMQSDRKQKTEGRTEFPSHPLHRVVAISILLRQSDKLVVRSLKEPESSEAEIIQAFFDGIGHYRPRLVSWNGRGFDLPVLHYRAMLHGITAPEYWERGENDQSFRWNNYHSRYQDRHTDLMDVLAGYNMRATAPLHEVAQMLGLPGKLGMRGGDVWENFLAGKIAEIRQYCEIDVLNTYLIYLRYQLMRGELAQSELKKEEEVLTDLLENEQHPHFAEFLNHWQR